MDRIGHWKQCELAMRTRYCIQGQQLSGDIMHIMTWHQSNHEPYGEHSHIESPKRVYAVRNRTRPQPHTSAQSSPLTQAMEVAHLPRHPALHVALTGTWHCRASSLSSAGASSAGIVPSSTSPAWLHQQASVFHRLTAPQHTSGLPPGTHCVWPARLCTQP